MERADMPVEMDRGDKKMGWDGTPIICEENEDCPEEQTTKNTVSQFLKICLTNAIADEMAELWSR